MNRRTSRTGLSYLSACLLPVVGGCAGTMREEPGGVNYAPGASYHLMMAEIAAQRGEYQTAVEEYLATADAARTRKRAARHGICLRLRL